MTHGILFVICLSWIMTLIALIVVLIVIIINTKDLD
jgi:hypothetical protein